MKNGSSTNEINSRIASLRNELSEAVYASGESSDKNGVTVESLQEDLRRRQESYIRRQRTYEEKIKNLEDEVERLNAGRGNWMAKDDKVKNIREMHKQLMKNVEHVQESTAKVLKDQEKDLLRAFRARLFDIQSELEVERTRSDVGASTWIEKNRQLERGLDWAKEMADRLERVNQGLQRENTRLKSQFKTQEDDREFLIRQLVTVKKDNVQLRQELESKDTSIQGLEEKLEQLQLFKQQQLQQRETMRALASPGTNTRKSGSSLPTPGARPGVDGQVMVAESELRYKEIIKRLKKLLDTERKNLLKVRAAFSADLETRTELEVLLRQCVEDVRSNIAKQSKQSVLEEKFSANELEEKDREKVLELLLSQERVVTMLYKRTFPTSSAIPSAFNQATSKRGKRPSFVDSPVTQSGSSAKPEIETIYANRMQKK